MTEVSVWPGWLAGGLIGLYTVVQYWASNRQLGCSLAYGSLCGLFSRASFFHTGELALPVNWRVWFVLGLPLGGLLAALTSADAGPELTWSMGGLYESVLPAAVWARGLILFAGGILMGYGARLAGGCTSGHAIAGCALVSPPSLVAAAGFFAGALATVQLLFNILA
jgi:uncharacterized membrane protein YedE/YeeE